MASPDPSFALVFPTVYGPMIVNRHDTHRGGWLMVHGRAPDHGDVELVCSCLRVLGGEGMVLDVGANIGVHTLAYAAVIGRARRVHAFEAQRTVFHMLAGNVGLNGLTHVHCHHLAVGDRQGRIEIPQYDYDQALNFGAVEFGSAQTEPLAQARGDDPQARDYVPMAPLDSFGFDPVALLKVDVEGMEKQVLDGAEQTIRRSRPLIFIEHKKSDAQALRVRIEAWDYVVYLHGDNFISVPAELVSRLQLRETGG